MGWQVFAGSVVLVLLPLLVVCVLLCHRVPAAAGEVLAERWVLLAASLFALAAAFFLGRLVTASLGRLAAVAPPAGGERFTGQVDDLAARIRRVAEAARESAERVDAETRRRLSAEDFLQLYRQLFDNLGEGTQTLALLSAHAQGRDLIFAISDGAGIDAVRGGGTL